MLQKIFLIALISCVFGLLVLNRVDLSPQVEARVVRSKTNSTNKTYAENNVFRRGEVVSTEKGEFLELWIGSQVRMSLDEQTNLEIKSLSKNAVRVGFGHGRILVHVDDANEGNLQVDTPTATHRVVGRASFIGYDFKQLTSVIPLFVDSVGSIRTTIPFLNQTFEVTHPIVIHDVNPPIVEDTQFNETSDGRREFYLWVEQQ